RTRGSVTVPPSERPCSRRGAREFRVRRQGSLTVRFRTRSRFCASFWTSFEQHKYLQTADRTMPHFNVNPIDAAMFADGFSIAEHHRLAREEEALRVRAIRGEVLSAMFEVEAKIDYAIGDLILPYK